MGQAFDEITRKSAKEVQIKCNLQKLIFISNFNRNISKSLLFDAIAFIVFQQQKVMKKIKREQSMTSKVKQTKQHIECKNLIPCSKKNLQHKKQIESHKENKLLLHEVGFIPKPTKKTHVKSKQRSKSLLCDRKMEIPAHSSKRYALMDLLQKRAEKQETDISAHVNSVRYDKQVIDFDKMYSNFLSPQRNCEEVRQGNSSFKQPDQITPKLKLLQQENETLRTNLSAIKEEMNVFLKENQAAKEQNKGLKQKISEFQLEIDSQISQLKIKEVRLISGHKVEKETLQTKVHQLQQEQEKLLEQKKTLETLVKNQHCNITLLEKQKRELESQCEIEIKQKQALKKDKEEARKRIQCLEQELQLFESNLKEFEQIKDTYESRLTQLQKQKQKIKKNAFQLLEMVQNYRQI